MKRLETMEDRAIAVKMLRALRGWSQTRLAEKSGVSQALISQYESFEAGTKTPSSRQMERLARGVGLSSGFLPDLVSFIRFLRRVIEEESDSGERGAASSGVEGIARDLAESVRSVASRVLSERALDNLDRQAEPILVADARACAVSLLRRLESRPIGTRRLLVSTGKEYRTPAFSECLCTASAEVTPDDPVRALVLAELALLVATQLPEPDSLALQSFAWPFVGNAKRVCNDLAGADEAFRRGHHLASCSPRDRFPLARWRVFDLEASLRRDQRRFREAIDLLDKALACGVPDHEMGRLLLNKSFTLEQMGEVEHAVEALKAAEPLVVAQREPRLTFVLRFNLAVNLCHLRRFSEAKEFLVEARALATQLGNDLDLVRVLWLEGRVAIAVGRTAEGLKTLKKARDEFAQRDLPCDMALVCLELAVFYLEHRRHKEVKALAQTIAPIFRAQGIHPEVLAALTLFQKAVEEDVATVEVARRITQYLRGNPYGVEGA